MWDVGLAGNGSPVGICFWGNTQHSGLFKRPKPKDSLWCWARLPTQETSGLDCTNLRSREVIGPNGKAGRPIGESFNSLDFNSNIISPHVIWSKTPTEMENCQKGVFLFEAEMGQPPRSLCGEQSVKTTLVVPLFRSLLKSATIVREKMPGVRCVTWGKRSPWADSVLSSIKWE